MCIQDSSNIKPKSGGKTSGNKVNDNLKNLNGVTYKFKEISHAIN